MAGVTLATRLAGPWLMTGVRASPKVERFLEALSSSVLAALVATAVARGGAREALAVAAAAALALLGRGPATAMLAGMAAAALHMALTG